MVFWDRSLVKQHTHASQAIASLYKQEIEKVCKLESDRNINVCKDQLDKTEPGDQLSITFSYKQPCCNLVRHLHTVVCPPNTDLYIHTSQSNFYLPSSQTLRHEHQDLPGSGSDTLCRSSRSNSAREQEEMSRVKEQDVSSTDAKGTEERTVDACVFELSKQFVTPSDLRQVAFRGLRIPACDVEKQFTDNRNDITSVAYKVLSNWLCTQENTETARKKMILALKKADKSLWIQFVT